MRWRVYRSLVAFVAVFLVALVFSAPARAADPLQPKDVPDPLKPWVPWVLYGKEDASCPIVHGGTTTCAWPTRLELVLSERGGSMRQEWRVDAKRFVPLPGDERRWPQDVRVDGKKAVVVLRDGKPSIELAPGVHKIEGGFFWDSLPESLAVPPETGLLALTVRGKRIGAPARDPQGAVWLQRASSAVEGDALEVVVHRKIDDDVPLRLTTRIQLSIAGKNREIVLGRALPAGFVPLMLDAQLPTRVEPDSRLRVQARAGSYVIELAARAEGPVAVLERPAPDGPWREGDEVWVYEARPELRVAEVEGVSSIDPQQTTLIDAWKRLPAYPMKLGTKLRLVEKRRGDADPPPDQLTLARQMWIDFDGEGVTVSDRLTGTLSRSTRLEMLEPTHLGRVAIRGKDQFITHLGDARRLGVEIRQGELEVVADSRFVSNPARIPAVGWNHDFVHVSATLNVPPGYRILHASGVDEVPGTWLRHFTLLEIFLVLVLALATARLYGPVWGAVALLTLVLIVPESGAPKWIWAVMLGFEALVRVLPEGLVRRLFAGGRFAVAMILVLVTIPFLVEHVRQGMFPALAQPHNEHGMFDGEKSEKATVIPAPPAEVGGAGAAAQDMDRADKPTSPAPVKPKAANEVTLQESENNEVPKDHKQTIPERTKGGELSAIDTLRRSAGKAAASSYSSTGSRELSQLNVDVYDPNAMVQTGPGLPSWNWTQLDLRWSGPVERTQELRLWIVGPSGNLVLALLRAALIVTLALRMMPFFDRLLRLGRGGGGPRAGAGAAAVGAALGLALILALPTNAAAQTTPGKETLEELEKRLLAPPSCSPQCVSSSRLALDIAPQSLRARLELDVGAKLAVPLPGGASQWLPERVDVDGKPASGLLLRDGKLYVVLEPGSHDLVLEGALPDRETVQVPLPLKPRRVEADARGWKLEGLHEDGLADDSLQLTRVATNAAQAGSAMETTALPPFVRVERTLRIGLSWQVETKIVRASPLGAAVVVEVPLLAGESVTTPDIRIAAGKVLVNLASQAQETSWKSVLDTKSPIRLIAPKGLPWVETWRLDLSPIWHAAFDGIPPVHPGPRRFSSMPEWRPWPGETVSLAIARPEGAVGQTLTIDESLLEMHPGLRSTDGTLSLRLRASRGGQHSIALPPGAVLEALKIGGVAQPIRQEGQNVALPITPGTQKVDLTWREMRGIAFHFAASPVDLHLGSVNADVKIGVGPSRWVLWVSGPRLGPAVLFWSLLLILLVIAFSLSRIRFVPLSVAAWMLLAIGLSQIDILAGAVVVAWLVALGAREHWPELAPHWFDLRQLGLALLTLAALAILVVAVHQGLLGQPDMQIEGNGSNAAELHWFDDRVSSVLPQPSVVSVPMLVYRIAMLGWALWLAFAILKWLRFGWRSFTTGGLWKPLPRRPPRYRPPPQGPMGPQGPIAPQGPMPMPGGPPPGWQGAPVPAQGWNPPTDQVETPIAPPVGAGGQPPKDPNAR